MPTTVDRFFAVVQICQNQATMQNNMRANVQTIQASFTSGPLQGNIAGTQQAFRGLGMAFQQRLAMNQAIMSLFPAQLAAGATAIGVAPGDVTSMQSLLGTWAGNLSTATVTNGTDVDTLVSNVLANVSEAMLPF